jgi:hypothetical protein
MATHAQRLNEIQQATNFFVLNLNNQGNRNHQRAQTINEAHSKILENDKYGKVKRVKFEELKYDLNDLF